MPRPNIIIILADDLGYSDIAAFGGEIDTPGLDRLASRGLRMSSFYVTPRCSPSRAALLTGRQPHSVGVGVLTNDNRPHGYPGSLSTDVPTIAELLREQGYRTGLFGKWHLANEVERPAATWPTRRGFEAFRGMLQGAGSYYQPPMVDGEERLGADELPDDFYLTDDITAGGVDFVRQHGAGEEPFFLMLAYTAPHWPLHAREATIAKYRERFSDGWHVVREARLRRQQELGIAAETATQQLSERSRLPDWSDESAPWEIERMATYAAQVESLDDGVSQVLDTVAEIGAEDDTLVLFLSDNGGCAEDLPTGMDHVRARLPRPFTRSGEPMVFGNDPSVMPGPESTFQSYGERWATVSNTPFRMWKRWVHEGGISTPMIVSWPGGGVPAGELTDVPGHVTDVLPTVLEAIGRRAEVDGESLLRLWRDPGSTPAERCLYWEHVGNAAVRRGPWKLVREWGKPWELYDIGADRGESRDLADERPDLVEELADAWTTWADSHGVIPWQQILDDHVRRGLPLSRADG